jgi:uncharacterized membrane protein YkoI
MKAKGWTLAGIALLIGATVCVITYAGKHENLTLPDAVKEAINALYPQAAIKEAKVEEEGLKVYEIELEQDGQEIELTVTPDGTIVEVEAEVAMENLPPAVAAAIAQAAEGAEIEEIKTEVTYWVIKLVPLDTPLTSYEAELNKDGNEIEIELAADGTVLKQKIEDEDDGDDDDDEDEEEVSIDQVPAVVKATILKEAQGGTIEEIERETEDGKTIYEAEVVINGQEVEIEVAADGTLLSKEVDDDNDDDDD